MTLVHSEQLLIVTEANWAPSVHNSQPARWRFDGDRLHLFADPSRFLEVGDPSLHDAGLSCGAALEGAIMALAARGIGTRDIEDHWMADLVTSDGLRRAASLTMLGRASAMPLQSFVKKRYTWRGAMGDVTASDLENAIVWAKDTSDVTLVSAAQEMAWLAEKNDQLSVQFFSNKPYRDELRSWMRMSRSDPGWHHDGLNAEAMQMSAFEARAAKIALASPTFELIKALGLARSMISEKSNTLSAAGVVLFHVEEAMSAIETGRAFYRMWLELTRLGFVAWPMAVLADDPECNEICKARFEVPQNRRLVNILRFGGPPVATFRSSTARLKAESLIIE